MVNLEAVQVLGPSGIMTLLTSLVCQLIILNADNIIPASVGATIGTVVTGVKILIFHDPTKRAISTAIGSSASAGAITRGIIPNATAGIAGILNSAMMSCMSAAAFASVVAGVTGVKDNFSRKSVGMLAVGTSASEDGNQVSYDCWKNVIHEDSQEPSRGMLLKDLAVHPHVTKVTVTENFLLPHIVLENIWGENFEIEYVITWEGLSCHARNIVAC